MHTRSSSSSNPVGDLSSNPTTSNPKRRNRRRSKQPFILEESLIDTMANQHTMAKLLRAPTKVYAEAIMVPPILAEQFELKHSLIYMMTSDQFSRLEKDNPHDHIRAARPWLEKEPPRPILTWEDLVSKFINKFFPTSRTTNLRNEISNFQQRFDESFHEAWDRYKDLLRTCPYHGFTELYQLDTFYNALNPADQDSLNSTVGGNLLERRTQDVLTIIEKNSRDPLHSNIPYPSRMHKQKQQEKDEVQIHKFWQMFKQLHINITLADALILTAKYQNMLKALLSNKKKLLELANTSLNENCSTCKALANLGASINLMPLSVWKKLGLPELISTRMTLELANRAICTLTGIARDVFVSVGKFTFQADFVIVDYESDTRVPLILGRTFLRIARALIDVHGEEMILRDGDDILTLNMRHDNLFATNHLSGNSTFSSHPDLTSLDVKDDIFDPERGNVLIEKLINLDSTKDLPPPHNIDPLSCSITSSSPNHFLEELC
nr:reverse transcriptase domain-containing protein [Tanacetum cinerariifolium]